MKTSDDVLKQTLEVYHETGSQAKTAERLGLCRTTIRDRLAAASARGFVYNAGSPVPPGFLIRGHSSLYSADGELKAQWVKTQRDLSYDKLTDVLEETFGQYKGKAELINAPNTTTQDDLLTVYVISDHHLGLYAWAEETGTDYDTAIASKVLREAMAELVSVAPASRHALILNLGDFFHSDNDENRTRRSGNALDVDTRYARVLKVGVELKIATIEYALQRHMYVETRDLQGNHDPYAALALQVATQQFFRSNPRVVVHVDPAPFYWKEFGKVLIGSTHGDMAKPIDMPGIMAAKQAEAWGRTQHRYIYIGHTHQKQVGGGEKAGAQWEVFRCLAAKDAWANAKGYVSGRSMVSITHHKEKGEWMRQTVNYEGPK